MYLLCIAFGLHHFCGTFHPPSYRSSKYVYLAEKELNALFSIDTSFLDTYASPPKPHSIYDSLRGSLIKNISISQHPLTYPFLLLQLFEKEGHWLLIKLYLLDYIYLYKNYDYNKLGAISVVLIKEGKK